MAGVGGVEEEEVGAEGGARPEVLLREQRGLPAFI